MDSGDYNETNYLFNYLMVNMTIDNNIFGFITDREILYSIPDELTFLDPSGYTFKKNGFLKDNYGLI